MPLPLTRRARRSILLIALLSIFIAWSTTLLQLLALPAWTSARYDSEPKNSGRLRWYWSLAKSKTIPVWIVKREVAIHEEDSTEPFTNMPDFHPVGRDFPRWSGLNTPPTQEDEKRNEIVAEVASGWPFVSAISIHHKQRILQREWTTRWGIPLFGDTTNEFQPPRCIPLLPIWSGLTLNVLFWYCLIAPPYLAFALWRSARRRRLSRCINCNYPIHSLPKCPECGLPSPPPRSGSSPPPRSGGGVASLRSDGGGVSAAPHNTTAPPSPPPS